MLSVMSLAGGTLAIYCAEKRPDASARLEAVGGLLIVIGLALIGFAMPLFR